jgi:hypothetical protein
VNERGSSNLSYPYIDSQRLKDTFFSPPEKKFFPKRNFFIFIIVFLILLSLLFLSHYRFIFVPRTNYKENNAVSLLSGKIHSSLVFLGENSRLVKKRGDFIYLSVPPQEKVGLKFDFENPLNLNNNYLLMHLKKTPLPLKMEIVVRDALYFSNSLTPLVIDLKNEGSSSYREITINLKEAELQNTNLSNITQIKLYFYYPQEENAISPENLLSKRERWILIKNLALVKRGEK